MLTKIVSENPNFQVITHNGKRPRDGGLRLGYRALDPKTETWHTFWLLPLVVPPLPPQPPQFPLYATFPRRTLSYECPSCFAYTPHLCANEPVQTSDYGTLLLHKCRCGQFIRV